MADTNPPPHPTFFQRVREAWPLLTFGITVAVAIAGSYMNMKMAQAETRSTVSTNGTQIAENKTAITTRVPKWQVDAEFRRVWDDIKEQVQTTDELDDKIDELGINNERMGAKIELEVEKLRNELKQQAAEQSNVLQQILREVQE